MPLQRALSIAQPKNEKTPEKGNQVGLSNEQLKAAVGGLSAETLVEIDQDGDGEVDAHASTQATARCKKDSRPRTARNAGG